MARTEFYLEKVSEAIDSDTSLSSVKMTSGWPHQPVQKKPNHATTLVLKTQRRLFMLITVYIPEDDYHHRDEYWEIYDTSGFEVTEENFREFVHELAFCRIRDVYDSLDNLPDHMRTPSKSIHWYDWNSEMSRFDQRPEDIGEIQKHCQHRWRTPSYSMGQWYRECSLCNKTQVADSVKQETKQIPVFYK